MEGLARGNYDHFPAANMLVYIHCERWMYESMDPPLAGLQSLPMHDRRSMARVWRRSPVLAWLI